MIIGRGKGFYRRYAVCAVGFFVSFCLLNRKDIYCGHTCLLGKPFRSYFRGKPCLPGGCSFIVGDLLTGSILACCGETIRSGKRVDQKYAPLLLGTC